MRSNDATRFEIWVNIVYIECDCAFACVSLLQMTATTRELVRCDDDGSYENRDRRHLYRAATQHTHTNNIHVHDDDDDHVANDICLLAHTRLLLFAKCH